MNENNQSIQELYEQGFEVISPSLKNKNTTDDWGRVIRNLQNIKNDKVVVLMPGWKNQPRSMFEAFYAVHTGKILIDFETQQVVEVEFSRILINTHFKTQSNAEKAKRKIRLLPGRILRSIKIYKTRKK